jgi:putative membrane protein
MNWKHVCMACSLATALVFTSCDKNDEEDEVNAQDDTFISAASKSNRAEIELGTMALQKGTDDGVKTYAQMMVTEHSAAQSELVNIYNNLDTDANINDSLDADQVAMRNQLMALAGPAFDSAYLAGQSVAHQKTLTIFDAEINGGQNTQVKGYASSKRPSIAAHKTMADSTLLTILP